MTIPVEALVLKGNRNRRFMRSMRAIAFTL